MNRLLSTAASGPREAIVERASSDRCREAPAVSVSGNRTKRNRKPQAQHPPKGGCGKTSEPSARTPDGEGRVKTRQPGRRPQRHTPWTARRHRRPHGNVSSQAHRNFCPARLTRHDQRPGQRGPHPCSRRAIQGAIDHRLFLVELDGRATPRAGPIQRASHQQQSEVLPGGEDAVNL